MIPPMSRFALLSLTARHAAAAARLRVRAAIAKRPAPWDGTGPLRVAFDSAYPTDHFGTVARFGRWTPHLERLGCKVTVRAPCDAATYAAFGRGDPAADARYHREVLCSRVRQIAEAGRYHVVVVHRGLMPSSPWQRPTFERLLARFQPRLIYDFYDAIWMRRREDHAACRSAATRWLGPADTVQSIARAAKLVTVTGEFLAEFARNEAGAARVEIVPMMLEPSEYEIREPDDTAGATRPLVVGWMGNAGNLPRLASLADALRAVSAPIRLRTVSSEPIEIEGVDVEALTHPWSAASEREDLLASDVGLLPLFDAPYDRGKFPFKLLQYAAAGLPIVATPVAIDETVFVDGESILYARSDAEWTAAIDRLAGDPTLRRRLGAAARAALERHYSFEACAPAYYEQLASIAATDEP